MSDYTDLIIELRNLYRMYSGGVGDAAADGCDEAADALEAQGREIEDLRLAYAHCDQTRAEEVMAQGRRLAEAEALLREAQKLLADTLYCEKQDCIACRIYAFLGRDKA